MKIIFQTHKNLGDISKTTNEQIIELIEKQEVVI